MKNLSLLTVGLTVAASAFAWNFPVVKVTGPSMEPTFHTGERLTVARYGLGPLRRGDVVVAKLPEGGTVIKRVFALGGESVRFDLNGHEIPQAVPEGTVFLVGDNPRESLDSRAFGAVPERAIVGKVWQRNPSEVFLPETLSVALIP